jgi:transcriptional regulator with XRE-family HTH domain
LKKIFYNVDIFKNCWKEDILVMAGVHTLLARNIKKYRQILGLSQAALAEKINCSTTFIGNIEIKKRFPSSKNIDRIARALGVKPADLFAEKDDSDAFDRFSSYQDRKTQLKKDILEAVDRAFTRDG